VNTTPESPYRSYEFTPDEIFDSLTGLFDKEKSEGKKVKVKI
jgi:hypothetical protein